MFPSPSKKLTFAYIHYLGSLVTKEPDMNFMLNFQHLNDMIEAEGEPAKKKQYELKLQLLDQIGWTHVASYEKEWMHVRFPATLPLF